MGQQGTTGQVVSANATITWDAARRLAVLVYTEPAQDVSGAVIAPILEALDHWFGELGGDLVVDLRGVARTDDTFRRAWAEVLAPRRFRVRVAVSGSNAHMDVVSRIFEAGVGVEIRAFRDHDAALASLHG